MYGDEGLYGDQSLYDTEELVPVGDIPGNVEVEVVPPVITLHAVLIANARRVNEDLPAIGKLPRIHDVLVLVELGLCSLQSVKQKRSLVKALSLNFIYFLKAYLSMVRLVSRVRFDQKPVPRQPA